MKPSVKIAISLPGELLGQVDRARWRRKETRPILQGGGCRTLGLRRGELWWADLPAPAGRRPLLLLSRNDAYQVRALVTVAPVTTRVRGIPVEVALEPFSPILEIGPGNRPAELEYPPRAAVELDN